MKLSIVMPVYNESAHIDEVITRIQSVVLPAAITSRELIIVDDGSSDGTQKKLMNYSDDSTMVIHSSRINFGKGTAIRIGLTYVTGDIVLVQDGDLEYDPNDYPALLAPIIRGEAQRRIWFKIYEKNQNIRHAIFQLACEYDSPHNGKCFIRLTNYG